MSVPLSAKLVVPDPNNRGLKRAGKSWLLRVTGLLAALYLAVLAGFDYSMHQPPDVFSHVMMHLGPIPFLLFPFETMWKSARAGHLQAGDRSPDFTLPRLDHSGPVTLSSFRDQRPVVLVFGSYT